VLEKSYLIPQKKGQLLSYEDFDAHTTEEHKFEFFDGKPFSPDNTFQEDRLLIMLLYSVGFERFVNELLPDESKKIILQLLKSNQVNKGLSKKEKLSLLKDMILSDKDVIDVLNQEESDDYFDCVEIFLQTSNKIIMEASLATRFLIIRKAKERSRSFSRNDEEN
jgi:hypothetical protein